MKAMATANATQSFLNRHQELITLQKRCGKSGFGFMTGRRRVGKTALLRQVVRAQGGWYHQAIEGTPAQQIGHLVAELKPLCPIFAEVMPSTWAEFFHLLARESLPPIVVFDEFPYWVQGDSTVPSVLQKWIDHELSKHRTLLMISGSAQSMLYSQCLQHDAPLYGHANLHMHLAPMSYAWFCKAYRYPIANPQSFERYSLVGGIPHYWRLMPRGSPIQQATALYYQAGALLAEEPIRILQDETVTGNIPKAMMDLIGRGVSRPGEVASRLGIPQGHLSRPLALLCEIGLVERELPFGESVRTTKRVLYQLRDPALSFYYGSYLPSRSVWDQWPTCERSSLIHRHAARCWEHFCRQAFPGAARYWEGDIEIDLIAPLPGAKRYVVGECKWTRLTPAERQQQLRALEEKFHRTPLAKRLKVEFRLFTQTELAEIARSEDRR